MKVRDAPDALEQLRKHAASPRTWTSTDSFGPNLASGRLLLADGELLDAETTEAAFLASRLAARTARDHGGDGHRNYGLGRVSLDGTEFSLCAYFREQRLTMFILAVGMPDEASSWDDWTLEREMARKAVHDEWLQSHLGERPWIYAWGSVWSEYDPRSACSSWGMNFHPNADG